MKSLLLVALGTCVATSVVAPNLVWAQEIVAPAATLPDTSPFDWKIRLKAGQKFRTTTDAASKTINQLPVFPGAPAKTPTQSETASTSRTVFDQNVLSSDEKGARIEVIYREMTQKMSIDGKVQNASTLPDMNKKIAGARISYTLSPQGKISDVQGAREYFNRMWQHDETQTEQQKMTATMRENMAPFFPRKRWQKRLDNLWANCRMRQLRPEKAGIPKAQRLR